MRAGAGSAAIVMIAIGLGGCSPGYVLRSGWHQGELLRSRVPLEEARQSGRLSPDQLGALDRVAQIKAFGRRLGLQATRSYDSIALGWERRIWNVSACAPLSFESKTWWFPIVGRVPYLGYFDRGRADRTAQSLRKKGW